MPLARIRTTRLTGAAAALLLAAALAVFTTPATAAAQPVECRLQVHYGIGDRTLFGHQVEVTTTNVSTTPVNTATWKMRFDYRTSIGRSVHGEWGAEVSGGKNRVTAVSPELVPSDEGGTTLYYLYPDMSRVFGFTLQGSPAKPLSITLLPTVPGGHVCELDASFASRPLVSA
jgi:hypothetical protein